MKLSHYDVIENIVDTLQCCDGRYLVEIHNKICSNKIKYTGDSLYDYVDDFEKEEEQDYPV